MPWTDEMIDRLRRFCEHADFMVTLHGSRVDTIAERAPLQGAAGWPAYFMSGSDEPREIEKTSPADWAVLVMIKVDWRHRNCPSGRVEDWVP